MVKIGNDWDEILHPLFESENYKKIREFLKTEYASHTVYPDMFDIFNAFKYTPYKDVKIVILGQDPYHNPGQAHGLAFSVNDNVPLPKSLINIYKELKDDLGIPPAKTGNLTPWAKQGVLLLNTSLTVRAHEANSHSGKGWEIFTDSVISLLNERKEPLVFMLWGGNAKSKRSLIDGKKHLVLTAAHPSPLSASNGFFGCGHFSTANAFLKANGMEPVNFDLNPRQ